MANQIDTELKNRSVKKRFRSLVAPLVKWQRSMGNVNLIVQWLDVIADAQIPGEGKKTP